MTASAFIRNKRPWVGTVVILVACTFSFITKLIARRTLTPNELGDPHRLILQIGWAAILSATVIIITLYIDRLPLSSIGIRWLGGRDMLIGLFVYIVGSAVQMCLESFVAHAGLSGIHIRTWELPPILDWASITGAVLGEELVFRGYLIERCEALTGSTVVAITASSFLFAFWHLPLWGVGGVIINGAWGILFALLYVWRRNLTACMFTHFLADAIGSADIAFSLAPYRWGYWAFSIYFRVTEH